MKRNIIYLFAVIAPVVFLSCSKELSCKNDCVVKPQIAYNYFFVSYNTSFTDATGNSKQMYSWPSFDTTSGILDSVVITEQRTLRYSFLLSNPTDDSLSYVVSVVRYDNLSQGSLMLINHYDSFPYGPLVMPGFNLTTVTPSLLLLNHDQLSCVITNQDTLNTFTGSNTHVVFHFAPVTYTAMNYPIYKFDVTAVADTTKLTITYYAKKESD